MRSQECSGRPIAHTLIEAASCHLAARKEERGSAPAELWGYMPKRLAALQAFTVSNRHLITRLAPMGEGVPGSVRSRDRISQITFSLSHSYLPVRFLMARLQLCT
jgi:hypothetical protein